MPVEVFKILPLRSVKVTNTFCDLSTETKADNSEVKGFGDTITELTLLTWLIILSDIEICFCSVDISLHKPVKT